MTSRGLGDALEGELKAMGAEKTLKAPGGVFFDGNWALCYRANLRLRSASRVVLPILDFPAYSPEELYGNLRRHDYTKYISTRGTIAVEASVRDCGVFRDQRFVAMKAKDAVVDQFREKFGERPNVDAKKPDLRIIVRAVKSHFAVSIDTTGDALFKRGYRIESVTAPLKENVAAALIELSGWDRQSPIVDPMCGSGTFLIEAALMAMGVAPGTMRKGFAFQRFLGFKPDEWEFGLDAAMEGEKEELPFKMYGFDIDRKAVAAARANVHKAGLSEVIEIERHAFETLQAPCPAGTLMTNPPYGERLGDKGDLLETYKNLAFMMKTSFKGWPCWVLSGDPELSAAMRLKAERRIPAFNGKIECRFLKYNMF
jgi:putative N6-adenine-specific DNA methylase